MTITRLRTLFITSLLTLAATLSFTVLSSSSASAAIDNTPDCDNVAVIKCGVDSVNDMREKAAKGDVPKIFRALGITQAELRGEFENGIVYRDGRVTVDGKVVATDAKTAGRNFGGTPIEGTNAGVYPTSKFVDEGQTAYVKMVNGKFSFAVIKACGNPVSATPKVHKQTSEYQCVSLKVEEISRTKRKFIATATADGDAKIEKYEFGFGDGMGITVSENTYTYEYKKTGTFDTNVVVHVNVNGQTKKTTRPACEKTITIKEVPVKPVCPYDNDLPKNSPDCVKPKEPCPIKGKEELPKNDDSCVVEEITLVSAETPPTIAETGPAAIVAGIAGSGTLGYGAYSFASSRRRLISSMLRR